MPVKYFICTDKQIHNSNGGIYELTNVSCDELIKMLSGRVSLSQIELLRSENSCVISIGKKSKTHLLVIR